jgi:meso-butanediol dehydrogenase / (S,S)-butanediol dehydrogenase / diacetyl reductase
MSIARFSDRSIFVTGASSGLGRATATLFAAEGAKVFAVDVNRDGLAETIGGIRKAGGRADGGHCDVADGASVDAAIAHAVELHGGLDILVNVAGIGRAARFEEIDPTEWQRTLGVNLTGPYNTMRAAIPHLLKGNHPNIVNVASTAGLRGQAYAAHYAASKAGLINLTRTIALEFVSRGIRANCICPAGIASPLIRNFIPREDFEKPLVAYYSPPIPHKFSQPEEIARAILFLASDDVPMITGAALTADWGTLA